MVTQYDSIKICYIYNDNEVLYLSKYLLSVANNNTK